MSRLRLRRRRSGQTDAPISDPSAVLASRAYVTLKVSTPPAGRGAQHVFEAHLRQPCAAAPHNSGHDVAWSRDQEAWLAHRSDRSNPEVGGSSPPRPTTPLDLLSHPMFDTLAGGSQTQPIPRPVKEEA